MWALVGGSMIDVASIPTCLAVTNDWLELNIINLKL